MMLTDLADVLHSAGLTVVEEPGWKARGHGQMVDVRTIICHHTGGLKDLRVIIDGRPGLAGPLAQCWLARDGVWHVVAAGLCWHAGVSRSPDYTNSHAIGIEAEATGVDPWPPVQYDSYVRGAAALSRHYDVRIDHVLGHKETCAPVGRKTDPNFDMPTFRNAVIKALTSPLEDDMPTVEEFLNHPLGTNPATGKPTTVGDALDIAKNYSYKGWQEMIARRGDYARVAQAVAAELPQSGPVTPDELEAALRKVLGSVDDTQGA